MTTNRLDTFVTFLSQLPTEVWEASATQAPSCQWLKPYSETWPFGRFAALYVLLGLNNYQLKGRAEVGYWPKVVPLIPRKPASKTPHQLQERLLPFFNTERMGAQNAKRLVCFTDSPLCRQIWESDAASLAAEFPTIWKQLARTMNQKPQTKTIAFAMKCFAYALILVEETGFDFGAIPVPVDSRVRTLSSRLGVPTGNDDEERARWKTALDKLRSSNPDLTMVHLDSILWQIGTLPKREIKAHLGTLRTSGELSHAIGEVINHG